MTAVKTKFAIVFSTIDEQQLANKLCVMIKRNRSLMHLNISRCLLTNAILISLFAAIKSSKSLQAIHISDNPGLLDSRVTEKIINLFGENDNDHLLENKNSKNIRQIKSNE